MYNIIISGFNGHMGQIVKAICEKDSEINIVAGFDINTESTGIPVFSDFNEFHGKADAVIDFSNPAALESILSYCSANKIPAVLCTTGYKPEQLNEIKEASKYFPIFKSANMSLGINLLSVLAKRAAEVLGTNYDIEIVERHHRRKLDAPSGTALMLADAVNEGLEEKCEYVYDRSKRRLARPKTEIGISAIRGGNIVGDHDIIFAGDNEVIELKHSALSREVFAEGAVAAAKYISTISVPGIYDMNDMLNTILA